MKSLVQEASSVIKAIEKAWTEAGKPQDFSVRIFEEEKRSFFGFLKKQAIVSIVYEEDGSKKQPVRSGQQRRQQPLVKKQAPVLRRHQEAPAPAHKQRKPYNAPQEHRPSQHQPSQPQQHHGARSTPAPKREVEEKNSYEIVTAWSAEFVKDIHAWLAELIQIMGIQIHFEIKVEGQLLKIEFERPVLEVLSEERMLFSSFAYILMQFMKRKYKKKLRGCRLALSSRR